MVSILALSVCNYKLWLGSLVMKPMGSDGGYSYLSCKVPIGKVQSIAVEDAQWQRMFLLQLVDQAGFGTAWWNYMRMMSGLKKDVVEFRPLTLSISS